MRHALIYSRFMIDLTDVWPLDTTMAEFHDYGPGFNLTGREEASNITIEMTPWEYEPYSTPAKVFQYPFSGEFGNVAWIDENPQTW